MWFQGNGVAGARAEQRLDHYLPSGFSSLDELDLACADLIDNGVLHVVDNGLVRWLWKKPRIRPMV